MPSYRDYAATEEDNLDGFVPTRFPEGGFKGTWVNQCFRYMAAVIRNLGDYAAKLPTDDEGDPVTTNGGVIGTLAFQSADDVNITGGVLTTVRGAMPIGSVIQMDITWAEYVDRYVALLNAGWVVCDGRTVTNPYTNASVTLPDYTQRYLRMFATTANIRNLIGSQTQTTTDAGARPAGVTGDTALTTANLPIGVDGGHDVQIPGVENIVGITGRTATGHHHTVPAIPDHAHAVDMTPPSVNVIFLKRVW